MYTDAHTCGSQRTTSRLSSSVTVPLDSEIRLSPNLKLFQSGWQTSAPLQPACLRTPGLQAWTAMPSCEVAYNMNQKGSTVYFLTQTSTLDRDGCSILLKSQAVNWQRQHS